VEVDGASRAVAEFVISRAIPKNVQKLDFENKHPRVQQTLHFSTFHPADSAASSLGR
jgi:hypothetical protein